MNDTLLTAILAGLGGMLGWGFADFFAKKTIDRIGDVTTLFWGQFIGIFPILALFLLNPSVPRAQQLDPLFVGLLGVFSGLSYIPAYVAFGKGKISILSPIFASYAVVVALISATIFHESLNDQQQFAILVVFTGILLISTHPRDIFKLIMRHSRHITDGVPEILLATLSYSFWLIALDSFLSGRDWVPFLLGIRIFSTITLFIYAKATRRKLFFHKAHVWPYLIGIGLFDIAAFSAVSYGFSVTSHTAVVAVLSATFSLPTIILARTFLKERITPLQTLASLTILIGVIVLTMS
jgi:drug/metabolite transporter (DMT)-like permease